MRTLALRLAIIASASLLASCGQGSHMSVSESLDPLVKSGAEGAETSARQGVFYDSHIRPIFKARCASCHNEKSTIPNWLSYAVAFKNQKKILHRVVEKGDMPPAGAPKLEGSEVELIAEWISTGALETAGVSDSALPVDSDNSGDYTDTDAAGGNGGPPNDSPPPKNDGAVVTSVSFKREIYPILERNCAACHNASSGLPNWLDYNIIFEKRDRVWQRAVIDRNMPPSNPLAEADLLLLKEWLTAGAPENGDAGTPPAPVPVPTATSEPAPAPAPVPTSNPEPPVPGLTLTYKQDVLPIFRANCAGCHDGGIPSLPNWTNYPTAYGKREAILDRVVSKKNMPPSGPLKDRQLEIIRDWIAAGAPEEAPAPQPSAAPQPEPSVSPIPAPTNPFSYETTLRPRVFEARCTGCHNSTSGLGDWLSYDSAFAKRERIYQRVVVDRDMPYRGRPMTDEERDLVSEWFKAGAPR